MKTYTDRKGLDKFRKWVDKHHAVAVPAIYNPTVFMELQ